MFRFALPILLCISATAFSQTIDAERLKKIDSAVSESIQRGNCPGAVVLVVHRDKIVHRKAYGKLDSTTPMELNTVFDLASLTKPVATATSAMLLIERGKLKLSDPFAKHWPEFAANGKESVTVEQCLLHTSGLIADNSIKDYGEGSAKAFEAIANLKLETPPGTQFKYSDVGYLALGKVVEIVAKSKLDEFARKEIFEPLKMTDTGFLPNDEIRKRCAPTGEREKKPIQGVVHDPRSFAIGGVAGHAGLFGTADDLARYARMLLNRGELDGQKILSPLTVELFTKGRAVPPKGQRSLGWDVDTGFSAPRGELFRPGENFGHTGFTGTSIWIDPPSQTAVIVLANRTFISEKVTVTELRRQIATIVASALSDAPKPSEKRDRLGKEVIPGLDVLVRTKFKLLQGANVGLVTNHTGKSLDGTSAIDLLHQAPGVKLVALFSPEHGLRGDKDEKVGDGKDEKTGLPIYSLYGEHRKPTAESLKGIDTLVYDIQDIGCRFYTYISTLGLILETAKEFKLKVVVLDRPNPLGGILIEGPVRDANRESFVAFHEIPIRHGMTVGEIATLFNIERKLGVELTVMKCENWKRTQTFSETDLPWRNPSPNMRHWTAAQLYPGIGILETTNLSVGRGTERPFEWIGAPYLDGRTLAAELNALTLPGVRFIAESRTPTSSTFKDKPCGGVNILIENPEKLRPVALGLNIARTLKTLYPNDWEPKRYDTLLVHKATFDGLLAGKTVAELEKGWAEELAKFQKRRQAALLYE